MIHIREAALSDILLIHNMATQVFPHTYKDILSDVQLDYMMEWMYSEESLRKQITEDGHIYYLAFKDEIAVGYVSIRPEGDNLYHLEKIYVLPNYQGLKLGKRLFMHAIEAVKSIHPAPCSIHLNVNRNNKALHFYEYMGMKKIAEGDFPIGNGYFMNDYIMSMDV